jgi:hypothetical protein
VRSKSAGLALLNERDLVQMCLLKLVIPRHRSEGKASPESITTGRVMNSVSCGRAPE